MDIKCKKCGEPWDIDTLHDVAEEFVACQCSVVDMETTTPRSGGECLMARPDLGSSKNASLRTEWFVWYDSGDLTDCLYGPFETEARLKQAVERFLADEEITNVSVWCRSTITTEFSILVTVDLDAYLCEED